MIEKCCTALLEYFTSLNLDNDIQGINILWIHDESVLEMKPRETHDLLLLLDQDSVIIFQGNWEGIEVSFKITPADSSLYFSLITVSKSLTHPGLHQKGSSVEDTEYNVMNLKRLKLCPDLTIIYGLVKIILNLTVQQKSGYI